MKEPEELQKGLSRLKLIVPFPLPLTAVVGGRNPSARAIMGSLLLPRLGRAARWRVGPPLGDSVGDPDSCAEMSAGLAIQGTESRECD